MNLMTFVVTCKGRLAFLRQSLPTLLLWPNTNCVLVDFDCPDQCGDWVQQNYPQVQVIRVLNRPQHHHAEAHNIGAAAVHSPWLCFTDADILLDPSFGDVVLPLLKPGFYYRPEPTGEGIAGTLVCSKADFHKTGGYDEVIWGWGYEDADFHKMLRHVGVQEASFPARLLSHMPHSNDLRGKHQDQVNVARSWQANKLYSLVKYTVMENLKELSLNVAFREKLYQWAVQSAAQFFAGKATSDLKVGLNNWILADRCDFVVNTAIVFSLDKKLPMTASDSSSVPEP